jgi:hypothetical protein
VESSLHVFSESDISIIKQKIIELCCGKNVVPRKKLYSILKDQLEIKIDESKFCQAISQLILDKIISGYEIRRGRSGGLHLAGIFDKHDAKRKEKLKKREERRNNEIISIGAGGNTYLVKMPAEDVIRFFTHVLKAETDPNGNVSIGGMCFQISNTKILMNYIEDYCGGVKQGTKEKTTKGIENEPNANYN